MGTSNRRIVFYIGKDGYRISKTTYRIKPSIIKIAWHDKIFRDLPCICLNPIPFVVDEAVLYGSRAKGNPKTGSDIDLTLKGERLNLKILNTVECELDDLLLPYSIDLSIHHQIDNPDLLDHITRIGKCFYKKHEATPI